MSVSETPPQNIDLESYNDLSVGEILQRTREHYGQSISQVEVNLRIRAAHLQAIENGDLSQLPGRVYAIGFVRAYSEYLGLDGDKIVQLFKSQSVGKKNRPDLKFKVAVHETQTPNAYIILICLLGIIGVIAYLSMTYTPAKYVEIIPPVPQTLKKSALVSQAPQSIEDIILEDEKELAKSYPEMELVISQDSWVEIKDATGKLIVSEVLKPGDKYIIPDGQKGLVMQTGNAGGITVFIKGKKIGEIGENAEVIRNISLNPENFKSKEKPSD